MRNRVFFKLAISFLLVLAVATFTLDLLIRSAWEDELRNDLQNSLTEKVQLFAQQMDTPGASAPAVAKRVSETAHARATVIQRDGKVLADTSADADRMENHRTRPEFVAALQQGRIGSNVRRSHTVGIEFLYVAAPTSFGAVRLAYPITSIQQRVVAVRRSLLTASLVGMVLAMILAAILAHGIARRLRSIAAFAEQIADGNLAARIEERSGDEIGKLAAALDETAAHLEQNFTALEKARTQLEALLNSIQDAVLAVSGEGKVQWANGAMSRLLQQSLKVGEPMVATLRDPDLLRMVQECLETRSIRRGHAAVLPGRSFEGTAAPIAEGGAVLVLHDVSEIERVERTRRDFIANVSHELRTPLTSIQGYVETLLETQPAGSSHEFLEIALQNAKRMAALTEDLLTLARVESGEERLELEAVPAAELLAGTRDSLAARVREKGMELAIENGAGDAAVAIDRDAVYHVFSNLVDNALKYAGLGGKLVLGAKAAEGGVEFYVRDFGPGIAYEHLPRLFERFYRVDKGRSRETGGTGLGLAIVKHIVLNHGGAVRVESELNHGSTFYFFLPLAGENREIREPQEESHA